MGSRNLGDWGWGWGGAGGVLAGVREFNGMHLAAASGALQSGSDPARGKGKQTEGQGKADKNEADPQDQNQFGFCLEGPGR